jgi:Fur family peroxide stress response transcriptional regulator
MKASMIEKMKERGLKLTSQRLSIIDALVDKALLHPSADLIFREAKKTVKSLSLSTVYATLSELSRYGIIKLLEFDTMENRYELDLTPHVNVICRRCKKILDYELPFLINSRALLQRLRFFVTDSRFEFYGYCEECGKRFDVPLKDQNPE